MQTRVPCGRVRVIGLWRIRQTGATGDGERQDPSFMICFLDGVMQLSITEASHRAADFLTGHVTHYILPPFHGKGSIRPFYVVGYSRSQYII